MWNVPIGKLIYQSINQFDIYNRIDFPNLAHLWNVYLQVKSFEWKKNNISIAINDFVCVFIFSSKTFVAQFFYPIYGYINLQ